jgi:hypothetical protein
MITVNDHRIGELEMAKIVIGLVTFLLLAACADLGSTTPAPQASAMTSGVGHPAGDYPGPRAY